MPKNKLDFVIQYNVREQIIANRPNGPHNCKSNQQELMPKLGSPRDRKNNTEISSLTPLEIPTHTLTTSKSVFFRLFDLEQTYIDDLNV